jgi:hypothetical protein
MPKEMTFKVSAKDKGGVTVTWSSPEHLEDPRWNEVVDQPSSIHAAALRSVVISIQSGARTRLDPEAADGGLAAVQTFVNEFKYGVRQPGAGGGRKKVSISADKQKALKFSKAQLEALAEAGVSLPGAEE